MSQAGKANGRSHRSGRGVMWSTSGLRTSQWGSMAFCWRELCLAAMTVIVCACKPTGHADGDVIARTRNAGPASSVLPVPAPASPARLDRATAAHEAPAIDVGPDVLESIVLAPGQTLRVHLPASPATGFSWTLEDPLSSVLRLNGDPGFAPTTANKPGASAMQTWHFRAESPGRTALRFAYRRPWETTAAPAKTMVYDLIVR